MDNEKVSAEELAAEQAATQAIKEDDVRQHVIEEYGFDETADAEKITKAVAKETDHRKKLSDAIGQKIKYRTLANGKKEVIIPSDQKKPEDKKDENTLSTKDLYALMEAKVPEQDVEEVTRAAKLLGKSIPETLKDSMVQSVLARRLEERAIANATNTGGARRTTQKPDDRQILQDFSEGKIPEKGSEESEKLFWARRKKK